MMERKAALILLLVAFLGIQGAEEEVKPLLTGGIASRVGEFPSAVLIRTPNLTPAICGGTLVDPQHVITSAQCVMSAQNRLMSPFWLRVIAGDLNIVGTITSTFRIERSVTHIFVHPNYNIFSKNNDLAVLRLNEPIPEFHNTIDVAQRNIRLLPDGSACRLLAWGALTAVANSPINNFLRIVESPTINTVACNAANIHQNRVLSTMFCAGFTTVTAPPSGPCMGNLGSGLYCNGILTGVLTNFATFGCGAANNPGVYMDIRQYQSWINQQFVRTDRPEVGWSPI